MATEEKSTLGTKHPDEQVSMFNSLEEEREFHARKADEFKAKLQGQVSEFKDDATAKAKGAAIVGGGFLASYWLMRQFTGKKKRTVMTETGPMKITDKESMVWSLIKGAALFGAAYLAKDQVTAYLDRKQQHDEEQQGTDDDHTEL